MLRFYGGGFCKLTARLAAVNVFMSAVVKPNNAVFGILKTDLLREMKVIKLGCENLGLNLSAAQAQRVADVLSNQKVIYSVLQPMVYDLYSRIADELTERLFLYIPKQNEPYYSDKPQF